MTTVTCKRCLKEVESNRTHTCIPLGEGERCPAGKECDGILVQCKEGAGHAGSHKGFFDSAMVTWRGDQPAPEPQALDVLQERIEKRLETPFAPLSAEQIYRRDVEDLELVERGKTEAYKW